MSVCIAAICEKGKYFVVMADKMFSTGDGQVSYESQTSKIFPITSAVGILLAGDMALNLEIATKVKRIVDDLLANNSDEKITVEYISELYSDCYTGIRTKRAEAAILSPLALDLDRFHKLQNANLMERFEQYQMPPLEAIILGVDESGAHLHLASNTSDDSYGRFIELQNLDAIGYATIGEGKIHADSEFMLQTYTTDFRLPHTMLLAYTAKRRAEIALGIGQQTEICLLDNSPKKNYTYTITPAIIDNLNFIYSRMKTSETMALLQARKDINDYLENQIEAIEKQKEVILHENTENTKEKKSSRKNSKQRPTNKKEI